MYEELVKRLKGYSVARKGEIAELTAEAADAIEELSRNLDTVNDAHNEGYDVGYWAGRRDYEPKWIPVTERLPEIKEPVLAMVHWDDYGDTMMCYGCRYKTRWYLWNCVVGELLKGFTITHWTQLPEPPKEET